MKRFWILGTLAAISTLTAQAARGGGADKRLDIYWIDVEGGAATLVVTPRGQSILIDTGNPGHRDPDRIVQTATREAGLRQLDHVIITHYHTDHFGGAATLATVLPIKHLHDNGIFEGIVDRPDKPYLELKAGRRSVVSPGDVIAEEAADDNGAAALSVRMSGHATEIRRRAGRRRAHAGLCRGGPQAGRHDRQRQ